MPAEFYHFPLWVAGLVGTDEVVKFVEVILGLLFLLLALDLVVVLGLLRGVLARNFLTFWFSDVVEKVHPIGKFFFWQLV